MYTFRIFIFIKREKNKLERLLAEISGYIKDIYDDSKRNSILLSFKNVYHYRNKIMHEGSGYEAQFMSSRRITQYQSIYREMKPFSYNESVELQDDCSGIILIDENSKFSINGKDYNKVILIDNYQSNARKNFTIAHELGHFFMDYKTSDKLFAHRSNSGKFDPIETNANNFASELLMPYELLKGFVKEIENDFDNYFVIASAIATAFNVSQAAAECRYDKYFRGV